MSLVFGLSTARGQFAFSESFKYPLGEFQHQGPPRDAAQEQTGWTANLGRPEITDPGLVYPSVSSIGSALTLEGATEDQVFAFFRPAVNSGVVWVSSLMQLSSGSSDGYATLDLNFGVPGPRFGLINGTGVYGLTNEFTNIHASLTRLSPGPTPDWLLLKLDFDAGTETLYVNPIVSAGQPIRAAGMARLDMTAFFKAQGFDAIVFATGLNTGVFQFDEVRAGPTFDEVRTGR